MSCRAMRMVDVAPSEAFEKNTQLVIDLLDQIPAGRCTTYGALGRCIGIVPRYAALIMATAPDMRLRPGTEWSAPTQPSKRVRSAASR